MNHTPISQALRSPSESSGFSHARHLLLIGALLAVQPLSAPEAHAQNTYDWTMKDDIAEWGDGAFTTTGGTFTRDFNLTSSFATKGYSGSWNGGGGPGTGNDGPYDGRSGNVYTQNTYGAYTRTDPDAVFDLSQTGSSATIRTALNFFGPGTEGGVSPPLKGHALQFGLSGSSSFLGKTGSDALFIALDLKAASGGPTGDRWVDYDMNLYDESSDSNPVDGNWNWTPLTNLSGSADGMRAYASNVPGEQGLWHAFELTYTNTGANTLRLHIGVVTLQITDRRESAILQGSSLLYQSSQTIDLTISPLNLTALRPAFGFNTNDAIDTANAIGSGVNLDWESAYPTGFSTVPEPAGVLLGAMGLLTLSQRRRRAAVSA